MQPRHSFYAEGLSTYLYDGDVVDLHEFPGHYILKYGWAMLNDKPYKGWYFRPLELDSSSPIIQAASVNLSLLVLRTRDNVPDELPEPRVNYLLHS